MMYFPNPWRSHYYNVHSVSSVASRQVVSHTPRGSIHTNISVLPLHSESIVNLLRANTISVSWWSLIDLYTAHESSRSACALPVTRSAPRTLIQSFATYPKCSATHCSRNIVADNAGNRNSKKALRRRQEALIHLINKPHRLFAHKINFVPREPLRQARLVKRDT